MLLPLFEWKEGLRLSLFFKEVAWAMPVVQSIHLLAVAVFASAVLVVDLRLLGRGLVATPISELARTAEPWLAWSFIVLLLSGLPQMTSLAMREYYSPYFWWKMQGIVAGVLLTLTVRRRMAIRTDAELGAVWPRVVGITSIALWTGVAISGRLIGLLL